jgi:hypothetical protein
MLQMMELNDAWHYTGLDCATHLSCITASTAVDSLFGIATAGQTFIKSLQRWTGQTAIASDRPAEQRALPYG